MRFWWLQEDDRGFDAIDEADWPIVIDHGHKHPPDVENGPARDRADAGVQKSHHYLAAALLALQLGHNATTPTLRRQGSLVTADALPLHLRFSELQAMLRHDLSEQ